MWRARILSSATRYAELMRTKVMLGLLAAALSVAALRPTPPPLDRQSMFMMPPCGGVLVACEHEPEGWRGPAPDVPWTLHTPPDAAPFEGTLQEPF